ncbi:MAG: LamG domain-containing protein [Sedimentisphaerales bacterium]
MKKTTVFALIVFGMAATNVASADLVAQWDFSGNANDVSGNGYNGIVYGATLTTDRFGNPNSAYSFDGLNDYIDIPGSESLNLAGGFELEAWVRFTGTDWSNQIISKHISGTGGGYFLSAERDNTFLFYINGDGPVTQETYNDGQWHHVLGVYDGTTQYLYVDSFLVDQHAKTYTLFSTATVHIGGGLDGYDNGCFIGDIDDVRIYEIPEPATLFLLTLGGLLMRKRK